MENGDDDDRIALVEDEDNDAVTAFCDALSPLPTREMLHVSLILRRLRQSALFELNRQKEFLEKAKLARYSRESPILYPSINEDIVAVEVKNVVTEARQELLRQSMNDYGNFVTCTHGSFLWRKVVGDTFSKQLLHQASTFSLGDALLVKAVLGETVQFLFVLMHKNSRNNYLELSEALALFILPSKRSGRSL